LGAGAGTLSAGTLQAMASIATPMQAATSQNTPRQPSNGSSHCTGSVDATMPNEPVISIHDAARICARAVKRQRKNVIGAIRQALTPMPISTRAAVSPANDRASANSTQPITASSRNPSSMRLAPKRSSALPSGNCVLAKPTK
jgi:hypothetical protein